MSDSARKFPLSSAEGERPIRILLVEDNPADVRLTREMLRASKVHNDLLVAYTTEEAEDILGLPGEGAPEMDGPQPDLVLLDLNLPVKSGHDLLKEMKPHATLRRIPVVILSSSEAEEAQRMQSAFLANMSHEIRTPLTSVIGFAEAIGTEVTELELPSECPVSTHAGLIEQSGERLLKTLNGLLTLSKLEAEQMGFNAEPVDLHAEARWTAEELDAEAQEKGLDLHLETDDVRARADEGGVQIVVRNLLANAIKYTEEGGTVCVRTYREENRGVLEVEDTGIGMDPEKAVEQMGGRMKVETEKGVGSCFTVRLPSTEDASS
ncbi:MAG: sensor histidine kinase [Salinibacter sp.]|uniref:sensor histidine kinase n=1 Tax=Salinibacter sp. TaxID=2065818 RepID=UPI0035D45510